MGAGNRGDHVVSIEGNHRSSESNCDVADGDCTVTLHDGSTYRGELLGGLRHGHGVWKSSSAEYEGQWVNHLQHGWGMQVSAADGSFYRGNFANGRFNGSGRREWQNADGLTAYEGQHVDGLEDGLGYCMWPDGSTYEGLWCKGEPQGLPAIPEERWNMHVDKAAHGRDNTDSRFTGGDGNGGLHGHGADSLRGLRGPRRYDCKW
eukprot:NODE_4186_length_701_cov_459.633127.p1 GENE.NODE_4186_length_701_cov_459.633127~~NODE_4186_length_701_cov_459.633127.p1  ORF type:complete len:205 (+),score=28.30 NODE_4186_length_701_cov_459.633127:3-617(+)